MKVLDEIGFLIVVKSWADGILLGKGRDCPFASAGIKAQPKGRRERYDFVLKDRRDRLVLVGEFRLPDQLNGRDPYGAAWVVDTQRGANTVGASYFFTCNYKQMVLWETFRPQTPITDRYLDHFDWLKIRNSTALLRPAIQAKLRQHLDSFLDHFAEAYRHPRPIP